MEIMTEDLSIFFKLDRNYTVEVIMGLYVDASIRAETMEFEYSRQLTEQRFNPKTIEVGPFTFAGMEVKRTDSKFNMHQAE